MYSLKKTGGQLTKVISGPKWKPADYRDLLTLLFLLTKTMKSKGLIALEAHIEKPDESSIFKRFPKIAGDHFALRLHLRHAAHDDDEPGGSAPGRDRDGQAAGETPSRGAGRPDRAADHGRRIAGASASSPRCSASSRRWARSASRPKCSAA